MCRSLHRYERSLVAQFAGQPFVLLGVNSDDDRESARARAAEHGMTWQSWWDESPDGPIARQWGVTAWPSIFVIDADGIVRFTDLRADQVEEAVRRTLLNVQ